MGDPDVDYFDCIGALLQRQSKHHHLLVCPGLPDSFRTRLKKLEGMERLHILGYRSDVDGLLQLCDFFIDGFPLFGGMMRAESIRLKIPLLVMRNRNFNACSESDEIDSTYPFVAKNKPHWMGLADCLMHSEAERQRSLHWLTRRARRIRDLGSHEERLKAIATMALSKDKVAQDVLMKAADPEWSVHYERDEFCAVMIRGRPEAGRRLLADLQRVIKTDLRIGERWTMSRYLLLLPLAFKRAKAMTWRRWIQVLYVWILTVLWLIGNRQLLSIAIGTKDRVKNILGVRLKRIQERLLH